MTRFLIGFFVAFAGCSDPGPSAKGETVHATASDTIVQGSKPLVVNGCYQMILKRDTANLQLDLKDSTITGRLEYRFYEKDRNGGSLQGVLRNDTIFADYRFQSEGMTSVREVVFRLLPDGHVISGFGPQEERAGKLVFTGSEPMQFETTHPFIPVPCK